LYLSLDKDSGLCLAVSCSLDKHAGLCLVVVCGLDKDSGPCQAEYYRWFFSRETYECHEFIYTGCNGNANRFSTKGDCEKTCANFLVKNPASMNLIIILLCFHF